MCSRVSNRLNDAWNTWKHNNDNERDEPCLHTEASYFLLLDLERVAGFEPLPLDIRDFSRTHIAKTSSNISQVSGIQDSVSYQISINARSTTELHSHNWSGWGILRSRPPVSKTGTLPLSYTLLFYVCSFQERPIHLTGYYS